MTELVYPGETAQVDHAVDLAENRPADAAAALYTRYRQPVHDYCRGQLHERHDADDALQSTFLYAYMLLDRGVTPNRPLPWLYTIAHNVCRTRRRALRQRERVESSIDLDTMRETIGHSDPQREDLDGLANALAELPATQRHALLLREWQGLAYAEIATQLGITHSAVETLLFRARRNLARSRQQTSRLGALLNGSILLQAIRRFLPATTTKTTAAAVALGLASGATLAPFIRTAPRIEQPMPSRHAAVAEANRSPHAQKQLAADTPVQSPVSRPNRPLAQLTTSLAPSAAISETPPGRQTPTEATSGRTVSPPKATPDSVLSTPQNGAGDVQSIVSDVQTVETNVQTAVSDAQTAASNVAGALPQAPISSGATDISKVISSDTLSSTVKSLP